MGVLESTKIMQIMPSNGKQLVEGLYLKGTAPKTAPILGWAHVVIIENDFSEIHSIEPLIADKECLALARMIYSNFKIIHI